MKGLIGLTALAVIFGCGSAQAQYSDGTIKIGVMNDMSGTYSDLSGQGSVVAARMAVEDFGAAAKGMKVEIVSAEMDGVPFTQGKGPGQIEIRRRQRVHVRWRFAGESGWLAWADRSNEPRPRLGAADRVVDLH